MEIFFLKTLFKCNFSRTT